MRRYEAKTRASAHQSGGKGFYREGYSKRISRGKSSCIWWMLVSIAQSPVSCVACTGSISSAGFNIANLAPTGTSSRDHDQV